MKTIVKEYNLNEVDDIQLTGYKVKEVKYSVVYNPNKSKVFTNILVIYQKCQETEETIKVKEFYGLDVDLLEINIFLEKVEEEGFEVIDVKYENIVPYEDELYDDEITKCILVVYKKK